MVPATIIGGSADGATSATPRTAMTNAASAPSQPATRLQGTSLPASSRRRSVAYANVESANSTRQRTCA